MRDNFIDINNCKGFTLVELICVIIIVSLLSISLASRLGLVDSSTIQASRDEIIAASFFAQQTAMARDNIQLIVNTGNFSVTESGVAISQRGYPVNFPSGVTATTGTFTYDKLGHTTAKTITLTKSGITATVSIETTGYAH